MGATAFTATGRSTPPAPSSGGGWSGAHARTADELGGDRLVTYNQRTTLWHAA